MISQQQALERASNILTEMNLFPDPSDVSLHVDKQAQTRQLYWVPESGVRVEELAALQAELYPSNTKASVVAVKLLRDLLLHSGLPGKRLLAEIAPHCLNLTPRTAGPEGEKPVRYLQDREVWQYKTPLGSIVSPNFSPRSAHVNGFNVHQDLFLRHYKPRSGDTVVVLGAFDGREILLYSRLVGPEGRVFAVEAQPKIFEFLKENCERNRLENVVPVCAAVCSRNGAVKIGDESSGQGTSLFSFSETLTQGFTFDALIHALEIQKIDFLQINIEGSEREAIFYGREALLQTRYCTISCHDFRAERGDGEQFRTGQAILDQLVECNFELGIRPLHTAEPVRRIYLYGRNRSFVQDN